MFANNNISKDATSYQLWFWLKLAFSSSSTIIYHENPTFWKSWNGKVVRRKDENFKKSIVENWILQNTGFKDKKKINDLNN